MSDWYKLSHSQRRTAVNDVAQHLSKLYAKANEPRQTQLELQYLLREIERAAHAGAPDVLKYTKPALQEARKALKRLEEKTIKELHKAASAVRPLQNAELAALHQLETEGGIWKAKKGSVARRGAVNF